MLLPETVTFSRREREVLELVCLGFAPKHAAHRLEVSVKTINSRLAQICEKAGVERPELVIYLLQHKSAMVRDGQATRGLHLVGCLCDEAYCKGMRRAA